MSQYWSKLRCLKGGGSSKEISVRGTVNCWQQVRQSTVDR